MASCQYRHKKTRENLQRQSSRHEWNSAEFRNLAMNTTRVPPSLADKRCWSSSKHVLTHWNACGSKEVLDFQGKASFLTVQWKVVPLQVPVLLLSPRLSAMTVKEENLYLEMGVTESLKSYSLTPKNTEQSEITTSNRQPDVDEPDYGLWFLFTAAKIVSDWTAASLFLVSRFTNYRNVISWCIGYINYNKSENFQILAVLTLVRKNLVSSDLCKSW